MNKTAKALFCESISGVNRETVMADRKARSVVFKTLTGDDQCKIKRIIEAKTTENANQVFQEIGPTEYLVQLSDNQHVEYLLENGFDTATQHHQCHPPHELYTNVSILGLKAFISDDEVTPAAKSEILNLESFLKQLFDQQLDGSKIRSRVQWLEEGETPSKFFLRLENERHAKSFTSPVYNSAGVDVSSLQEIMEAHTCLLYTSPSPRDA